MKTEKLVRDNNIDHYPKDKFRIASEGEDLRELLLDKFEEEFAEVEDAKYKDPYEYADLIEVIFALAKAHGVQEEEIIHAGIEKRERKGAFNRKLVWIFPEQQPAGA